MKLFATIYLDEDVSVLVAQLLKGRGFDAVTTRDKGMLTKPDEDQLAYAVSLERCILTHNRADFEHLHAQYLESSQFHWGIIISSQRSPYEITRRLTILLNNLTADEIANQLLYI